MQCHFSKKINKIIVQIIGKNDVLFTRLCTLLSIYFAAFVEIFNTTEETGKNILNELKYAQLSCSYAIVAVFNQYA